MSGFALHLLRHGAPETPGLLMGRTDGYYTPAEAERLHALLPTPRKELVLYDSGHRLPPEYAAKSVEWLRTHLK